MEQKRLFLLDGMALVYRAFFAFSQNPRISSTGLNTSAMFGFVNTLLEVLQKEKPTHIAVAFDTAAPTERHIEFEAYKANREAMPEDLAKSLPYIFRLVDAFNIPLITMDGYEADDLIGTLAKQAEQKGFTTYMMTPDKDFGQLVSEHIKIYKPARMGNGAEVLGVQEVLNRWSIKRIDQVIDILGLMGDAVDNIPGIPGVGEKTAIKLVDEFDNVENLLQNTDKLKGKLKEKVEENKDKALLSKKLATINIECPIELDEKALEVEPANREAILALFEELEFRTLARRVFPDAPQASKVAPQPVQGDLFSQAASPSPEPQPEVEESSAPEMIAIKDINEVPHEYELVDSSEKIQLLIQTLQASPFFCFDTETTSLEAMDAELVGFSFAVKPHHAYYVPCPIEKEATLDLLAPFKAILEDPSKTIIAQNIKYDLAVMQNYGIELKGKLFDTMLAHYLIEADGRHSMDAMAETYLAYRPVSISTLIGKKGSGQLNMRDVALEKIKEYAAEDADITLQLYELFAPELKKKEAEQVFQEIEMPLVPVLAKMERIGVKVDKAFLNDYSKELDLEAQKCEEKVYELAGVRFNLASPKQLGEVLFDKLKLDPKAKKTKTGQYQTNEEVLSKLAGEHAIVKEILQYRQISKLKSTYVDALPTLIHTQTGRVHTSFNQAVAATGRLSSQNPNLQNIPIRTEMGREVRKAFIPDGDGFQIMAADYSQIELRIIAALANEEAMIADFKAGHDIHSATASKVFGVSLEEVDKEMRRKAKMVNFGIIYGISAFGLSQRLEIPRKEAAEIIEAYFQQYPAIKHYMNDTVDRARELGYVQTIKGRRRYIRDINSRNQTIRGFAERNAINAPIQGSAADMIKIAMIRVANAMEKANMKSRMILQVHDELLFEVHESETAALKELVIENMRDAISLNVPIEVEVGLGKNWLEAH
ncbi:MAG: DNA polymerase I [Bacteroidota bacterium]|nr:DNA polymerase I [Bacteroidota bacterium]MDX5429766.1 DNA polymerase I [Bacteroidota bacterium]MDX5468545.1 DNA polymerase I [Bacteroidota bacterium]